MTRFAATLLAVALCAAAASAADLPTLKRDFESTYRRYLSVAKSEADPAVLGKAARDLDAARAAYAEALAKDPAAGGADPAADAGAGASATAGKPANSADPATLRAAYAAKRDEWLALVKAGAPAARLDAASAAMTGALKDLLAATRAPNANAAAASSAPAAKPAATAPARPPSALDRAKKKAADAWQATRRSVLDGGRRLGERVWAIVTGDANPFAESFDETRIPKAMPDARALPAGFALGVNLPWIDGGYGWDVGVHDAWGTKFDEKALDATFARFARLKLPVVRWFLYANGVANPKFDGATGRFRPPDPKFLADLDRAVAVANRHKVRIVWSLLDFLWFQEKAPHFKIYSRIATDAALRRDFIEKAVVPLAERYADEPAIYAWEIMNEPEWVTKGLNYPGAPGVFTVDSLKVFVRDVTHAIKGVTTKPVTVGSAHPKWMRHYVGTGIDLYQCHFYDKGGKVAKSAFSAREFKKKYRVDAPVILGEFASRGSRYTIGQWVAMAAEAGYDGAWVWAWYSTDESTARPAIDALDR